MTALMRRTPADDDCSFCILKEPSSLPVISISGSGKPLHRKPPRRSRLFTSAPSSIVSSLTMYGRKLQSF